MGTSIITCHVRSYSSSTARPGLLRLSTVMCIHAHKAPHITQQLSRMPRTSTHSRRRCPCEQVDWVNIAEMGPDYASLRWAKPALDNGAPIHNFMVRYFVAGHEADGAVEEETHSGSSDYIVGGLQPGVAYFFNVRAQNSAGWGLWVPLAAYGLTKSAPPAAPHRLRVVSASVTAVHLRWARPGCLRRRRRQAGLLRAAPGRPRPRQQSTCLRGRQTRRRAARRRRREDREAGGGGGGGSRRRGGGGGGGAAGG
jgi:hypothetical protein